MICTLHLYLNGQYYSKKDIALSVDQSDLDRKENFLIREMELQSAAQIFRIENYRQIIKCQYNYDIVAVFTSKVDNYGSDEDFS
jgi:hypothetical protein